MKLRIVLVPTEISGQMGILCHGLRKKGLIVNGYNWFHSYIGYKKHVINTDAYELARIIDPLIQYCDVIHFHNGNTMLPNYQDLPYIHQQGKKLVMHHWGNDVRAAKRVSRLNPYALPPSYFSDDEIHKRLRFLSKYIDTAIVQDYEVVPYVQDYYKNVHVLPLACNVSAFNPKYPDPSETIPTLIHAPTNRVFKGSAYVESAIEKLRKLGVPFHYKTVEKMNHSDALQTYLSGDIIIDQVMCGTYGMLSVEAMAMGKVVVAFVRDDVKVHFPKELPIVNTRPETLHNELFNLIQNPPLRNQIGKASRKYVESYHDIKPVISKLLSIYEQL